MSGCTAECELVGISDTYSSSVKLACDLMGNSTERFFRWKEKDSEADNHRLVSHSYNVIDDEYL